MFKMKICTDLNLYFILILDGNSKISTNHKTIWKLFDKSNLKVRGNRIIVTKWMPQTWSIGPRAIIKKISKIINKIEKEL
ncbi:MAG: hypothetical protein ACJA1Z_004053 [Patiriisocius sp.]|jgi:hypothetical protein